MENQVKKKPRTRKVVSEKVELTEAGNPVMFVTIEEHQAIVDEKTAQIISLKNGITACEDSIDSLKKLNSKAADDIISLRRELNNQKMLCSLYLKDLNAIPKWIKKLFGVA